MNVAPGSIAVYADLACPWAHLAVHRLHETRRRLGLTEQVGFDLRAFPLELVNRRPTPKPILDAEIPVVGALEPSAGWHVWDRPSWRYPVTTLPALEAVQAAKRQSLRASEQLDRALRRALFAESRCISMVTEILAVADECEDVDAEAIGAALATGAARSQVFEHYQACLTDAVLGSPHLLLASGTGMHNPGIEKHWEGQPGGGFPVVDADDPSVYDELLRAVAAVPIA